MKPFSQACENNKAFIEPILSRVFAKHQHILEVGSGTGQHAVHFASALPQVIWQSSDLEANHPGIQQWIDESGLSNLKSPLALDVFDRPWPIEHCDGIYTANTLHIMPWEAVVAFFGGVPKVLSSGGSLVIYGPFNYEGQFTSDSNQQFDLWLKARGAHQGIRDIEKVLALAESAGLNLEEDNSMPANNRLLVFTRI